MTDNSVKEWVVIYTKPRCEKKLALKLGLMQLKHYLPMQRTRVQRSDRKVWVDKLLFNSYLFIEHSDFIQFYEAIVRTEGFLKVITNNKKPVVLKQIEIDSIKELCESQLKIQISQTTPQEGDVVYLEQYQVEGVVQRVKSNGRATIYIPSLNIYLTVSL